MISNNMTESLQTEVIRDALFEKKYVDVLNAKIEHLYSVCEAKPRGGFEKYSDSIFWRIVFGD